MRAGGACLELLVEVELGRLLKDLLLLGGIEVRRLHAALVSQPLAVIL